MQGLNSPLAGSQTAAGKYLRRQKRLNWNLVAGSNAFYVNKSNNHVEVFAGLENILKIFRVDFVAAFENGQQGRTGIRIGAGGILGGSVQVNRADNSASVTF